MQCTGVKYSTYTMVPAAKATIEMLYLRHLSDFCPQTALVCSSSFSHISSKAFCCVSMWFLTVVAVR